MNNCFFILLPNQEKKKKPSQNEISFAEPPKIGSFPAYFYLAVKEFVCESPLHLLKAFEIWESQYNPK